MNKDILLLVFVNSWAMRHALVQWSNSGSRLVIKGS